MTPTSNRPINKVRNGAIATAVGVIALALIRRYLWADLPADLDGPINTLVTAAVLALISGIAGYVTRIAPGEIAPADVTPPPVPDRA